MNTLRNFVVIFFLGIVVFLAGVMVGKSMTGNARNSVLPPAEKVVAIPSQTVPVAPLTPDAGSNELPESTVNESLPLPLPIASPEKSSAAGEGPQGLSGNGTAKPHEEIKYTFYESLTNKKGKTVPLNDHPVAEKAVKPLKEEKPAIEIKQTERTESTDAKRLVLQVASYPQEGKARLFRNALMQEGYGKAVVVAAKIPGKGTWYRVRIVDIKDKQTAKLLQERLQKQKSIRSFITE